MKSASTNLSNHTEWIPEVISILWWSGNWDGKMPHTDDNGVRLRWWAEESQGTTKLWWYLSEHQAITDVDAYLWSIEVLLLYKSIKLSVYQFSEWWWISVTAVKVIHISYYEKVPLHKMSMTFTSTLRQLKWLMRFCLKCQRTFWCIWYLASITFIYFHTNFLSEGELVMCNKRVYKNVWCRKNKYTM